jgi:hypothetical protein
MKNLDLLCDILSSNETYWLIEFRTIGSSDQVFTEVAMVGMPADQQMGMDKKTILVADVQKLSRVSLPNVFLSSNYAPFQWQITLQNAALGFPITCDKKAFLIVALAQQPTKDIFKYKKIIDELTEQEKPL